MTRDYFMKVKALIGMAEAVSRLQMYDLTETFLIRALRVAYAKIFTCKVKERKTEYQDLELLIYDKLG